MRLVDLLVYTVFVFILSACGGSGGGGSAERAIDPGSGSPGVITPPSTPTVDLTYYTLSKTKNMTVSGQPYTVTVTGYCVNYQSQDLCWDDGWQIPVGLTATHEKSFWGLCEFNGAIGMCSGGTSTDPVTTPKLWTDMLSYMATPLQHASDVYTQGTPITLTCIVNGSVIDCVDFVIDTSDTSL